MTRNLMVAGLIVLVVAAILFGLSFYWRSLGEGRRISESEKKIAQLISEKNQMKKEQAALQQEVLEKSRDLQSADRAAAELRNTEKQLQEKISQLQGRKEGIESELARLHTTSDELVSKLQKHIRNQEIAIKQYKEELSLRVLDQVLFESGMANITPKGKAVLRKVGEVLKGMRGEVIQVIGNTDDVPIAAKYRFRYASNWELSAARATAVVRFLQDKCGVDPEEMEAMGRSSYYPVASNATGEGRAKNRNVEIVIKPKTERVSQNQAEKEALQY